MAMDAKGKNIHDLLTDESSYISRLIRKKARKLACHPAFLEDDIENNEQDFRLELLAKQDRYDPARAGLNTFLSRLIDNKAKSLIREREVEKRDYRRTRSFNDTVRDEHGNQLELGETLDDSAVKKHIQYSRRVAEEQKQLEIDTRIVEALVDSELASLTELLKEKTEHEAARDIGLSRRQVRNRVQRLKRIYDQHNLRDFLH